MSKIDPDIETRMKVFNRDHGRCFICGRTLSSSAFNLHHRRMRSHAWERSNPPSNLITVFGSGTMGCHGRIHQRLKESYENGWLVSAYNDHPEEIPVFSEYRKRKLLLNN